MWCVHSLALLAVVATATTSEAQSSHHGVAGAQSKGHHGGSAGNHTAAGNMTRQQAVDLVASRYEHLQKAYEKRAAAKNAAATLITATADAAKDASAKAAKELCTQALLAIQTLEEAGELVHDKKDSYSDAVSILLRHDAPSDLKTAVLTTQQAALNCSDELVEYMSQAASAVCTAAQQSANATLVAEMTALASQYVQAADEVEEEQLKVCDAYYAAVDALAAHSPGLGLLYIPNMIFKFLKMLAKLVMDLLGGGSQAT